MKGLIRRIALVLALAAVPVVAGTTTAACHHRVDLSQLDAEGQSNFKRAQAAKLVNDVTTVAITANAEGKISKAATAQVLTINKQVLDVISANPQGWKEKAMVVITNARQALPPDINAAISTYVDMIINALAEANK